MASEKFIMVSLEDKKSKDLANVISNDTSRKILDFLSDTDATESDISKELKIPQSTVHYNIKHLLEHEIIEAKDFYWSEKGNKVNIYTVAQKLIIIAPKRAKIPASLKGMLPIVLLAAAAAGLIDLWHKFSGKSFGIMASSAEKVAQDSSAGGGAEFMRAAAEPVADRVMEASADIAATSTNELAKGIVNESVRSTSEEALDIAASATPEVVSQVSNIPNVAVWFFSGAIFALLIYILWSKLRD